MSVGDWSSQVILEEFPDIIFNSVHFIDFKNTTLTIKELGEVLSEIINVNTDEQSDGTTIDLIVDKLKELGIYKKRA